jgi:hypothetical protein
MSKRTLAAVAVIVLGVGILLTVFVVSSLWLSAGHSIPRQVLRGIPLATLLVAGNRPGVSGHFTSFESESERHVIIEAVKQLSARVA